MILDTFKNTNPGVEHISLLVSSSLSDNKVVGATINITDCNFQNLFTALSNLTSITLTYDNETELALSLSNPVLHDNQYFFYTVSPVVIDTGSLTLATCSNVQFTPPIAVERFATSDYNALYNNSELSVTGSYIYQVDRRKDNINPTNLLAIQGGSATPAEVQESNYSVNSYTIPRYDGSKLTSGSLYFDDPALQFRPFKGSIYPYNTTYDIIVSASYTSENTTTLWFNPTAQNSTETSPPSGRPIYEEIDNRFVRIKNRKVYDIDGNVVYLLGYDQIGQTEQPLPPIPSGSEFACNCYEIYLREGYYGEVRSGWVNFVDCSGSAQYRTFNTSGGIEYFYVSAQQITSYSADGVLQVPVGECSSGTLN